EWVVGGDLVEVVLDQVRRLFDVADALEPVLACLVPHQRGEFPSVFANLVGDRLQHCHAVLPAARAPRRKRRFRRRDGVADFLAAAALKFAEKDARVDRAAILEFAGSLHLAGVDDHRIALAEGRLDALDGAVELAMEVLHPIGGHRGVCDLLRCALDVSLHSPSDYSICVLPWFNNTPPTTSRKTSHAVYARVKP